MNLLQELFAQGFLSEKKVEELKIEAEKTGKTEEDLVLEKRIVPEDSLFTIKSNILKIPLKRVKADKVPADVLEIISEEASVNYKMASIEKQPSDVSGRPDIVIVGMVYPEDIVAQNALRFLARQEKFNYQVCLITPSDLAEILKQRRNIAIETKKALKELGEENIEILKVSNQPVKSVFSMEIISEEAPIVKMVSVILRHAIEGNASDIHIEPGKDKLNIRFRLNGVLHSSLSLPLKVHPAVAARIKILSNLKIDENRIPQDGRFSARINEKDIDFRVSTFPALYGEKVEIRVLDSSKGKKTFEELGLFGRNLDIMKTAIRKPYGMILSTGPTGSGKTTTQYAILRSLNQDSVNIVTIEDPIEYSIPGINQSQVKPEIGYTFERGLRQILRQDPNIIMVGEIRDEQTADLAINAALTGHIVLSTLHTNSSVGAIPRFIDMGVKSFLIPSAVKLIISQRLVRVLCKQCKVKIKPAEGIKKYILEKIKNMPNSAKNKVKISDPLFVYAPKGCETCGFTGYADRMGVFEVLSMTDELAALIQKNPPESIIFKEAQRQGMFTMEQEGILKVLEGQTTIEEVIRVAEESR